MWRCAVSIPVVAAIFGRVGLLDEEDEEDYAADD